MMRTLSANERRQLQPTVDWLMSEKGHWLSEQSAWDVVADPVKSLRFIEGQFGPIAARRRAFAEVKLSPEQEHVRKMSDNARGQPGSSISLVRPERGIAPTTPEASRKPGESLPDFQRRLRKQILDLGVRANTSPGKPEASAARSTSFTATPQGSSPSPGNDSFSEIKAQLLANEELKVREIVSHGSPVNQADTSKELAAALSRMKARGESTDIKSAGFSERYKRALKEAR